MRISDALAYNLASRERRVQAICSVCDPTGDGMKDVGFILEGPEIGRYNEWYDTYQSVISPDPDWYGLQFPEETLLNTLYFMHGPFYVTGGWWTSLALQFKNDEGEWIDVPDFDLSPSYDFGDHRGSRRPFETYQLRFPTIETCGIRLYGRPGGSARVTTVSFLGAGHLDEEEAAAVLDSIKMPPPRVFQMLAPNKLWDLIVKIRDITGISFDLQTREGLGLDHFLDEEQYNEFHQSQALLTDADSLYQIIGTNEGWETFGKEIIQARSWVYETRTPEIVQHHGGMAWVIIPIVIEDRVLGTIENRNLISIDGPDLEWHRKAIHEWGQDGRQYNTALKEVPIYSTQRINEIVELLQVIITLFEEQILRNREIAHLRDMAEKANDAKSEFVSVISHELKSPMTALKGYTSLLQTGIPGPLNDTQVKFLGRLEDSVNQMESLVSELSDISQIETGHLKLSMSRLPVDKLLKSVAGTFEIRIRERSQELELKLEDNLPEILGDYGRLKQVFTNILSNAHKYTPEGGAITIWARVEGGKDGRVVHISITDNGLGIRKEEQAHIFTKFFRSEDRQTREMPGTGLGLSITKELVELHNGRIWFESQFRLGTVFHVALPVI